jgi:hypothetical protein
VSYRPLSFSVFRGRRWRTVGLVVFFLSLVGSFALAATDQPWRDVLGVVIVAEMFAFIFAWTRWTDDQCSLETSEVPARGARRHAGGGSCR